MIIYQKIFFISPCRQPQNVVIVEVADLGLLQPMSSDIIPMIRIHKGGMTSGTIFGISAQGDSRERTFAGGDSEASRDRSKPIISVPLWRSNIDPGDGGSGLRRPWMERRPTGVYPGPSHCIERLYRTQDRTLWLRIYLAICSYHEATQRNKSTQGNDLALGGRKPAG